MLCDLLVKPRGDLVDPQKWESFANLLESLTSNLDGALVLDMINVNRIASNYIGTIISAFQNLKGRGTMKIIQVKPRLYELLSVLRLTEILTIDPLDDAPAED